MDGSSEDSSSGDVASGSGKAADEKGDGGKSALPAPQVNARIQQMIAMQKAQNAAMKQLISSSSPSTGYYGYGGFSASASPSGLRDLVSAPLVLSDPKAIVKTADATAEVSAGAPAGTADPGDRATSSEVGATKLEPIKPPASAAPSVSGAGGGDIHYQGSQKNQNIHVPSLLSSTPPHQSYRTISTSDSREEHNISPISYNSVLDHNATPFNVLERKRMQQQQEQQQHQLHTIVSQPQMEGQSNALGSPAAPEEHQGLLQQKSSHPPLRIEQRPPPRMSGEINWENMAVPHEYNSSHQQNTVAYNAPKQDAAAGAAVSGSLGHAVADNAMGNSPGNATAGNPEPRLSNSSLLRSQVPTRMILPPPNSNRNSIINYNNNNNIPSSSTSHNQHQYHYGGVGLSRESIGSVGPPASVSITSNDNYPRPPPPSSSSLNEHSNLLANDRHSLQQQQLLQLQQQQQQQQHHHMPQTDYHQLQQQQQYQHQQQLQRIRRKRRNIWWAILCYPCKCLFQSEHLGRSFCFGAIDGMLTGSGILYACIGLGLISNHWNEKIARAIFHASIIASTNPHMKQEGYHHYNTEEHHHQDDPLLHSKWILISLTLAACLSDGVCMAIGHVWSTRLVAGAAYEERKDELRNFETCRADAKARLVDGFLAKGMLKIDAMSLADTLEGYPDLFVGALLGDGLGIGPGGADGHNGSLNSIGSGLGGMGGGGGGSGMLRKPMNMHSAQIQWMQQHQLTHEWDVNPPPYGPRDMTHYQHYHHGITYESYSDFSDFHQDPDKVSLERTLHDSRMEGFFMMISFGLFSIVPSVIFSFLPVVVDWAVIDTSSTGVRNGRADILDLDRPHRDALNMVLSLSLTVAIMFLLGAWKSQFYSSHWCLFGSETVGVLLLCVATAYSVGRLCTSVMTSHFN